MISRQQATRRLMGLEFRHGLRLRSWGDAWRVRSSERLSGAWWWLIAVPLVLWLLFAVGTTRHSLVDWQQTAFLSVPGIVAWLLWAVGGAIAVLGAVLAGWVAWDNPYLMAQHKGGPPLTGMLPLRGCDVITAKAAGRTGALIVHLLVALAVLAVARLIMTGFGLVATAPSLVDPWLIDAIFVHFGLMIASLRIAEAGRWQSESVAGARFVAYILLAIGALFAAGRMFPVDPSPNWWSVAAAALAFAVVALLGLLQGIPPMRGLEERLLGGIDPEAEVALPTLREQHRRYHLFSQYNAIALRGLGGMRGRTAEWLAATASFVARTAAFFVLAGALLAGGVLAIVAVVHLVAPGSSLRADPAFFDFLAWGFSFAFAIGIGGTGLAAWPEAVPTVLTWLSTGGTRHAGPHLGEMLPAPPERVWVQRLMTLPVMWVLLAIGGTATLIASRVVRALLDPAVAVAEALWLNPLIVAAVCAVAAAISLCLFVAMPMLHRARKVVPAPLQALGCLGFAAFMGGIIAPIIALIAAGTGGSATGMMLLVSGIFGTALLAWLLVGLVCSYVLWKPDAWRRDEDGAASTGAVTRALFAYAFSLVGAFLAGTTFHTMIGLVEWGT